MSKLISKMPETHFQKSKTHFQKAETHFHRILLEWTWVEFGQKKAWFIIKNLIWRFFLSNSNYLLQNLQLVETDQGIFLHY